MDDHMAEHGGPEEMPAVWRDDPRQLSPQRVTTGPEIWAKNTALCLVDVFLLLLVGDALDSWLIDGDLLDYCIASAYMYGDYATRIRT